jgi:hypothetical protein
MAITIGDKNQQLDTTELIRTALDDGLNVRISTDDTWTFPTGGADGCVGKLMVSRLRRVTVPGANQDLAVHVTFSIKQIFVPTLKVPNPEIRVELANLHFTARPINLQLKVSGDSAIAATPSGADVSIHRGLNDWSYGKNGEKVNALAAALNISAESAQTTINTALAGFSATAFARVRERVVASLQAEISDSLLPSNQRGRVRVAAVVN